MGVSEPPGSGTAPTEPRAEQQEENSVQTPKASGPGASFHPYSFEGASLQAPLHSTRDRRGDPRDAITNSPHTRTSSASSLCQVTLPGPTEPQGDSRNQ